MTAGLGHAFARVLKFVSPQAKHAVVPVMVNTYYPPAPSAQRCVQFGRALANVLRRIPGDQRVVVVASGGLSHTKIDEKLDDEFIQALKQNDLDYMAAMRASDLVEGTSEIRNWIVTAAAADRRGNLVDYFPLYRTTTGVGCAMGFAYWDLTHIDRAPSLTGNFSIVILSAAKDLDLATNSEILARFE